MTCPKCGGVEWDGPKLVPHLNPTPAGWPREDGEVVHVNRPHTTEPGAGPPHAEALVFRCSCCSFQGRFQATVENGGPVAAPLPESPPKSASPKD